MENPTQGKLSFKNNNFLKILGASLLIGMLGLFTVSIFVNMKDSRAAQLETIYKQVAVKEIEIADEKAVRADLQTRLDVSEKTIIKLQEELAQILNQKTSLGFNQEQETPKTSIIENQQDGLNIDKLAYAVAMAETSDCTKGMGVTKNNCFGIMTWPNGKRTGKTYNSKEESYADFKDIWINKYGNRFPTYKDAQVWTGNDRPDNWLRIVTHYYSR